MSYLIVAAHPDDEVLGAGATIYKLTQYNQEVNVCILSGNVDARFNRPEIEELRESMTNSMKILGVNENINGSFPNIQMNTVPHIEIVKFIEHTIIKTKAEIVITHHPADLNNDHLHTSTACQAAVRLFQRRTDVKSLKELLFMEVLSSTEWGLNSSLNQFVPNTYIEISEEGITKKIEALSKYNGVMREYPHPRSEEALRGLAAFRGCQAGLNYAEAFQSIFRRYL